MRFTLTIDCGNAAFEDNPGEIARILRKAADFANEGLLAGESVLLRDANGNIVGSMELTTD